MKYGLVFVGFGEAGYNIAMGLNAEGMVNIGAYDVMQNDTKKGFLIRSRAKEAGVELIDSLEEAVTNAKYIFSLTSASVCVSVAKAILPYLVEGQTFCDLNSADPMDMVAIDELPRKEGVNFIDIGVLGSVPEDKHKTKMVLAGTGTEGFYNDFAKYNMNLKVLDSKAGGASALKLLKSIINKGMPQLFIEAYTSAAAYGVYDELVALTRDTFSGYTIEEWCNEYLYHTLVHAKRRGEEVKACVNTIERAGLDASMCRAAHKKLLKLSQYGYADRIGPLSAPKLKEVVDMILEDEKNNNSKKEATQEA